MTKTPFSSPANTSDLKSFGVTSAALAATFAVLLCMPQHSVHPVRGLLESRVQLAISMVLLLADVAVSVAGCRAVRRTVAAAGDGARAQIQAQTFRAASYGALGLGILVAPFSDDILHVLASDALGALLVLMAAFIAYGALTPSAVRSRLEREADQRMAAAS